MALGQVYHPASFKQLRYGDRVGIVIQSAKSLEKTLEPAKDGPGIGKYFKSRRRRVVTQMMPAHSELTIDATGMERFWVAERYQDLSGADTIFTRHRQRIPGFV